MPAKSKSQQRLFGMVSAYKKEGTLPDNPSLADKVKKLAKSISTKDAVDFAKSKHKGIPETVREQLLNMSLKDYLLCERTSLQSLQTRAANALKLLAKKGKEEKNASQTGSPHDFFFDFYPELANTRSDVVAILELIQSDKKFKEIAAEWQENLGFDLKEEIKFAIEDASKEVA